MKVYRHSKVQISIKKRLLKYSNKVLLTAQQMLHRDCCSFRTKWICNHKTSQTRRKGFVYSSYIKLFICLKKIVSEVKPFRWICNTRCTMFVIGNTWADFSQTWPLNLLQPQLKEKNKNKNYYNDWLHKNCQPISCRTRSSTCLPQIISNATAHTY